MTQSSWSSNVVQITISSLTYPVKRRRKRFGKRLKESTSGLIFVKLGQLQNLHCRNNPPTQLYLAKPHVPQIRSRSCSTWPGPAKTEAVLRIEKSCRFLWRVLTRVRNEQCPDSKKRQRFIESLSAGSIRCRSHQPILLNFNLGPTFCGLMAASLACNWLSAVGS